MDKVKFGDNTSKLFVPFGIMPEHVTLRVIAQSALRLKDDRQSGLINKKRKQPTGAAPMNFARALHRRSVNPRTAIKCQAFRGGIEISARINEPA